MLRYTPRVPNQKLSIYNGFPITEAAKSGFRRVKDGGVNDPPTPGVRTAAESRLEKDE